jgi:5-methylthioribose kinase
MKTKLTVQNIPKYLKSLSKFRDINIQKVEEIKEYTNVNYVFKVETDSKKYSSFYIKQAYPYVKIKPDFSALIERQCYEYKALKKLQNVWKGRMPQVIYYDSDNDVLIETDIGENAKLLAREVDKGRLHLDCAKDLGQLVGKLHSRFYETGEYPIRKKQDNKKHVDFILDFRLRGAREISPEAVGKLFETSLRVPQTILFGDWPHKNLLVTYDEKIRIVDFENVVKFDPASDIGYALADWLLEVNKSNLRQIIKFVDTFVESYTSCYSSTEDLDLILERATKYLGAMMLHRLVGVKNTNKKEEYLEKEVDLVQIGKCLLETKESHLLNVRKVLETLVL